MLPCVAPEYIYSTYCSSIFIFKFVIHPTLQYQKQTSHQQPEEMSPPQLKVLISGAGIAGPCLAYWLARTRLRASITIIERSPVPRVTGQAVDVRGPAIEIVKKMGLLDAVRSASTTEEGTQFLSASGKPVAMFGKGDSFTAEYEILRGDLSRLFMQATDGLENVRYVYADSIKSMEQKEKDVTVSFTGGSQDTYNLVVAADGSTSRTRSMFLDEQVLKGSYNFIGQYNAFFSIPRQSSDTNVWKIYNCPKGLGIMTRPHQNPSTMGVYLCITKSARGERDQVVEEAMNNGTEATKRMLHAYFDDAGWEAKRVLAGMDQADDFYMSRAAQVILPKWVNQRACVLGDSAWATFGVGTSLAIEGSYVLAGELSKIQSSDDVPGALKRYEDVFRPIYSKSGEIPSLFPQMMFPQTKTALKVRDTLLWVVGKTKLHKLFPGGEEDNSELPAYVWRETN
jgi:2-polyprenyl-6-methoxyphenol hydroxylase-like FAD-dependent oxidoreductase